MDEKNRQITILGSTWKIIFKEKDKAFKESYGYANELSKCIVIQKVITSLENDSLSYNEEEIRQNQKRVLRHEVVHAYLYECGLAESSNESENWALNEEMVDWFARLGPKIYKTWEDLNCI